MRTYSRCHHLTCFLYFLQYGFVLLLLVVMEIAGGIAAGVKRGDVSSFK